MDLHAPVELTTSRQDIAQPPGDDREEHVVDGGVIPVRDGLDILEREMDHADAALGSD
jgi:hypothetical protein